MGMQDREPHARNCHTVQALALNTHSVVLTSGTLSPLNSFASELGIPFQVTHNCVTQGSTPKNNQFLGDLRSFSVT